MAAASGAAQQPGGGRAGTQPDSIRAGARAPILGLEDPSETIERLRRHLELTEEQARDIRGLAERFRSEHADALERMRRMREEMRAAWELEGRRPGREDVDAIVEKHGRPFRELHPGLFELRRDVLEKLTEEQRARLEALRRRWRDRAGERFGPGLHGGRRHCPDGEARP